MIFIKVIQAIVFLSFVHITLFASSINSLQEAIDIAGKERMFSQKMLTNYVMIGMENNFKNSEKELEETIHAFDSSIESLLLYNNKNIIDQKLKEIKKFWIPIKNVLLKKPKKVKVSKLQKDLEELLHQADKITKLFVASSNALSNKIVNISGRQRMLSQRMASLYMLKVWKVKDPKFNEKLEETMILFKKSLADLKHSKLNTAQITKLLKRVSRSFMFFEFMSKSKNRFVPILIYKKSNDILKNMQTITELYIAVKNK